MSEIRNIPRLRFPEFHEEWKTVRFKDILLNSRLGGNYSNSEEISAFPLIKMGNLDRGRIKLDKLEFVKEIENLNPEDLIQEGDLFFNTRNTLELVGKVAIWRNELPVAYYNSNLMKIDFEENRFMNYRLNSFSGIKKLRRIATGTTSVAAIYTKDLLKISISIPILSEQQKISDFLTSVDKRIELLEKKKTLLETYKKGVMKKIFNQEIRFKDENGNDFPDWEEMRLGDITNKKSSNISANSIEQIEGDYIVYGATGELKKIDFYEMDRPYISIVKDGSGVGRVNMCKPFSSVLGTLDILTNNELSDLDFVFQFLSKTSFLKYVTGSSIPHIYYKDYSKLKMLVPTIEEQVKISEFLSSIDNQIELLETQIDKSKTWKKGLLQKMFV